LDLLNIENISKAYSAHQALSAINLIIPEQSIFGLLGPNGAGKTTLIRIINRIIQQDSGRVFLRGQEMDHELVRKIGYLPEERGLYKKMKVGEQLVYLAQLKGLPRVEAVKRIKQWLEKLALQDWWNKNVEDLSKGMAQKVQFIATVVHEPTLLILDEPFSGFDPINADLIKNEILELRDRGATIIFSTHRMESVEELCDHIALFNQSQKILDGPKRKIKEQHKKGLYQITFKGTLEAKEAFSVQQLTTNEEGLQQAVLKFNEEAKPNDLIQLLIKEVELYSFAEKIPTINEIFISKVTTES
jgi:ABC-2 type transport system ATP-binding protein|tara:strand:- start:2385 stop:3290 length:906 start_codon:yes stop_codon:yes gene_type:complete